MYFFPNFEPIHCSMSGCNCCFLICIQVFQEAGKVVWYSHLFKNFPQFVVIHTVKGFRVVNEAIVDVFMEFSCFLSNGCCPFHLWVIIEANSKNCQESGEIGVLVHCWWEY